MLRHNYCSHTPLINVYSRLLMTSIFVVCFLSTSRKSMPCKFCKNQLFYVYFILFHIIMHFSFKLIKFFHRWISNDGNRFKDYITVAVMLLQIMKVNWFTNLNYCKGCCHKLCCNFSFINIFNIHIIFIINKQLCYSKFNICTNKDYIKSYSKNTINYMLNNYM